MRYLLPKQIKANGLKDGELTVSEAAIRDIMRYYTREAGVRSLEREIAKICRKVVKQLLHRRRRTSKSRITVTPKNLDKYLGVRKLHLRHGREGEPGRPGHRPRLDRSRRRAAHDRSRDVPGKGKTITTGKLGDVMQESIQAAMSVVRARSTRLGIERGLLPEERHAHSPARGRDAEGRPERGHRHRHGDGLGAHRHPGALRMSR